MKTKALPLALVALAVIVSPTPIWADDSDRSNDERQIRQIEREWLDAMVKRDGAYLTKIETPDFTITGPDGKLLSKEENLKDATQGETVFDDIKIDRLKVRFLGDTSIVAGLGTVKAHTKNEVINGKYSWTDVFVKINGEWKAAAAHVTMVAKEKK